MLYIPFFLFILNGHFQHALIVDKTFIDSKVCMHEVAEAIANDHNIPEGGVVKGGCLPLGDDVKAAVKAPGEATGAI